MIFSLVYFAVYFSIFLFLLLLLWYTDWSLKAGAPEEKVQVSILIAARNEAHTIERCLRSIETLHYPPELIEVLIGDDGSEDATWQVVSGFIAGKPNFRLFAITEQLGCARGKGNVLAHLAHQATSDYFFITDADIKLPANWITAMLAQLERDTGLVTGITTTTGPGLFARLQGLEWLNSLGLIQVVADQDLPVTAMGNNMLVIREAYESTGGYEKIPFSVTEDVALFQEVVAKGYGFRNVYSETVLAETLPAPDLPVLLHQRKRWMKGSMHMPLYMKAILILYGSFYAVMIPFFFRVPFIYAFGVLGLKLLFQSVFLQICLKRINRPARVFELILFEFYQLVISVLVLIFYYLPVKVRWKGRKY